MKLKSKVIMEKDVGRIVVLNSGGFDSIVLANTLRGINPNAEIHSMHFKYGALNEKQQEKCVDKVCKKLDLVNYKITLPKISWSKSQFYSSESNNYDTQYLEYRNLIFLSYAISYAESIGAKRVYIAVLSGGRYNDTSDKFIKGINSALTGIEILTPFIKYEKDLLLYFANKYGVDYGEYFSCDTPNKDGSPCGKCGDCITISEMEKIMKLDHPHKLLVMNGYDYSDKIFLKMVKDAPIKEVRLLINNLCQLKCEHCFYGDNTSKDLLSKEELYSVITQADKLGVKNIHFSGKEPLFNDDILWYTKRMKEDNLNITFDLVTNGINIPKYAHELKENGLKKFYLSVDDVCNSKGVRSVNGVTEKALSTCCEEGIDVEVFIDLHSNNYNKVSEIVDYISAKYSCVKSYYIRTIRRIGNAESFELLTLDQLNTAYEQVKDSAKKHDNLFFNMFIGIEYENVIYCGNDSSLLSDIDFTDFVFTSYVLDNLTINLEDKCSRYEDTVTVTENGYVLGCASEVAVDYEKISVGNVKDHSLEELIKLGKKRIAGDCNSCYSKGCSKKCSFLY